MSYPSKEERREIHKIPLWVVLRWWIAVLFRGFEYAERYIRDEDR